MNKKSNLLLSKARDKVARANQELMKPHTDIVSFSVCTNARLAIQLLLESYLIKNNVPIKENESLALLLERCILHDKKFKNIDISKMECRHNTTNGAYCSSINKVSYCYNTAKEIEALIKN